MTQNDPGRRTQVIEFNGRSLVVRQLRELQMVHLLRYNRILQSKNLGSDAQQEAVQRMLDILHTAVVQADDRRILVEMEEQGEVGLEDLMGVLSAFSDDEAEEPAKPTARRGRPRKSNA